MHATPKTTSPASPGKLLYAQSGGVTAVINATAAAVLETCRKHKVAAYAARNGILGALREDLIDTTKETPAAIRALAHTPGGAFGSCRVKLKSLDDDRTRYERLIEVFRAHDIRWFLYNGGNDSADTALKLSKLGKAMGYDIRCIGVPKTVDNDLAVTDCCPGFGSVAKYTAVSLRECALDVMSMMDTSTKVFVMEVMGRHAGWIAASAGLAGDGPGDAPHMILFPELEFDPEEIPRARARNRRSRRLLRDRGQRRHQVHRRQVRRRRARRHRCVRAHAIGRRRARAGRHGARQAEAENPLGDA